jgi:hypothetical protein
VDEAVETAFIYLEEVRKITERTKLGQTVSEPRMEVRITTIPRRTADT